MADRYQRLLASVRLGVLLLLVSAGTGVAQTWVKTYGTPLWDFGFVVPDTDSGGLITGYHASGAFETGPLGAYDSYLMELDERLAVMDETGVDIQAVSPSPFHYHYWAEADLARALVQKVNDRVAEFQAQKPDRLVAMCTVPLQHPELAVTELERCYREHGMRGVEISTNVEGAELTRARLDKFFTRVEELDMLIFLHPLGTSEGSRMRDHYFTNLMGHPLESALAVGHLVFDGYLEQYPGLKICVAHGGGYIPSYWGRFDHPYPTRADVHGSLPHPPSPYVKKLYFDTVIFSEMQLRHLIEAWGADHILMGTDYPYDMSEPDPVGQIDSVERLSTPDKALVWGGNAQRLLGITV